MGGRTVSAVLVALLWIGTATATYGAAGPAVSCERAAGKALVKCLKKVSGQHGKCYAISGAACARDDGNLLRALDRIATAVTRKCATDLVVQTAGFGPAATVAGLATRLQDACLAESAALAARTFGGPHGAVLAAAEAAGRTCLSTLHKHATTLLVGHLRTQNACVDRQRKGGVCDMAKTAAALRKLDSIVGEKIGAACGEPARLAALIAIDTPEYLARVAAQARCLTALAHPDPTPLALDCGTRDTLPLTPRGSAVQIVLDPVTTGTRCGDGSPYAFWVRLAPAGQPVENVVVQMDGGGVCIFESDCASKNPNLFESSSDTMSTGGIMSNNTTTSPFANWTKVFLPYCTQDIFAGGGTTSEWPSITVHRYGARNVRAALRVLRDVIWRELAETPDGYSPERIRMLFGGTSAGGFGTLYNYHYVLDDLQWRHTAAWPDSALALDNGQLFGIATLGNFFTSSTPPDGWGAVPYMPPYCATPNCVIGPVIYQASAPRLKDVPEQQFLVLSNQVDSTQVSTTFFANSRTWINAARQSYCDTAGTNGLRYFLPAITSSTHVIATKNSLFPSYAVDGIVMRDWLAQAMTAPDTLVDAFEEGTLTTSIAGVNPFPCTID